MKKTFVIEIDVDHDTNSVSAAFGTTPERLADITIAYAKESLKDDGKKSECILALVEQGLITGGELFLLAGAHLETVSEKAFVSFLSSKTDNIKEE